MPILPTIQPSPGSSPVPLLDWMLSRSILDRRLKHFNWLLPVWRIETLLCPPLKISKVNPDTRQRKLSTVCIHDLISGAVCGPEWSHEIVYVFNPGRVSQGKKAFDENIYLETSFRIGTLWSRSEARPEASTWPPVIDITVTLLSLHSFSNFIQYK